MGDDNDVMQAPPRVVLSGPLWKKMMQDILGNKVQHAIV